MAVKCMLICEAWGLVRLLFRRADYLMWWTIDIFCRAAHTLCMPSTGGRERAAVSKSSRLCLAVSMVERRLAFGWMARWHFSMADPVEASVGECGSTSGSNLHASCVHPKIGSPLTQNPIMCGGIRFFMDVNIVLLYCIYVHTHHEAYQTGLFNQL